MSSSDEKDEVRPTYSPYVIGKRGLTPHDEEFGKLFPRLYGAMMPVFDAKQRLTREAGQLRIMVDSDMFKIVLSCPTEGSQATILIPSLLGVFDALEGTAMTNPAVWSETYDSKKKTGQGLKKRR